MRFELSTSEFLRWVEAELVPIIAKRVAQQIQVKELSPTRHAELPPDASDKKRISIQAVKRCLWANAKLPRCYRYRPELLTTTSQIKCCRSAGWVVAFSSPWVL
jgi:hypothetical protein